MKIQVRFHGVESSEAIVQYLYRRILQHLSRFGRQVSRVQVKISDLNGPRGGKDKRCRFTVTGSRLGSIDLIETHHDVYAAADRGLERLSHVIGRGLERTREPRTFSAERSAI